jgi:hypothetical protein
MTDEEKISGIYQQGKEQGPSAHLDSAILRAAHDAVESSPSADKHPAVRSPFSGSWPAMVSIAAVLIITVILVPLIEQQEPAPTTFNKPSGEHEQTQKKNLLQETAIRENVLPGKEKAKKRVMLNTPEQQLEKLAEKQAEKRAELKQYRSLPETDSAAGNATLEEDAAAMQSASPAPASVPAASIKLRQQTYKSEAPGRQKSLLMMDSEISEDALENDLAPQQWLEKIRLLVENGEIKTAKKELDEFKLRYPDEEIDPVLLEKIKSSH